jgi:prepilin-type processing-associated H-X9-DG protein
MDENLVGYLLNNLDPATRDSVESQLRNDPQARQRLESLRQLLAPLEEDRDLQPPADLTIKTLAFVAEHCCRDLPKLQRPMPQSASSSTPFWRRADVLVAASLLFTAVALGLTLIPRLRHQNQMLECKKNLSEYYVALATYREVEKKAPNIADRESPRNVAGMIAPILHDKGVLPDTASICCPATKGMVPCTMTLAQIGSMTTEEFQQQAARLLPCYAYSLGYKENGVYHCAMETPAGCSSSRVALMADRGPIDGMGNSTNHGGKGQNVLFNDGHVEFAVSRKIGIDGDDIYLNRDMKVAAGIDCYDVVLGSSASQP